MNKKLIDVGLGLNLTNMEGNFIIKAIQGNDVVIYSIETGKQETRPLADIDLALNAGSNSVIDLPLGLIQKSINDKYQSLKAEVNALEIELKTKKAHMRDLQHLEMDCEKYERKKESENQE